MYIVRDRTTKEIIHVNPAPLSQRLEGQEVYYQFDPDTMEIGKTDAYEIPKLFTINEKGEIVEPTLQEQVELGTIILKPEEKIVDNQIIPKTLSERAADGLITLSPTHKIVGEGEAEEIVEKTLSEQVAEGLLTLSPTQKIVGEGADERIVEESVAEEVVAEPIELAPHQKLVEGEIVEKTLRELFDEGLMTLDEVKEAKIAHYSQRAVEKRRHIIPDYKLQNAALGIYDDERVANYWATIQAYRAEFHRIEALVAQAETLEDIEAITEHFPQEIVVSTDRD